MNDKIKAYLIEGMSIFVRKILLIDLILGAIIALSFLVIGEYSAQALSDRLVWTGIAVALIAGILISSQTIGGRDYGVPGQFVRTAHGQNLIDFNIEVRQAITKRLGFIPRMFLIGAVLFLTGVLVQVLFV